MSWEAAGVVRSVAELRNWEIAATGSGKRLPDRAAITAITLDVALETNAPSAGQGGCRGHAGAVDSDCNLFGW
jgi:hypothetical protein